MTSSCWVWINLAGCMRVYRTRLQAHAAKVPAAASPA
jgi:hypothetical protein